MTLNEIREAKRLEFMDMLRQRDERRKRSVGRTMTAREQHLDAAAADAPQPGVIFAQWDSRASEFVGVWVMTAEAD